MAGAKQMVPGFNHNIKHRGTAYHVQTEDSGLDNPHIITHLFVGGNILASKKTSYADIVGAENLTQVVRELMEEQHKEMLRNLVNGVYDEADDALAAKARAYQPGQLATDAVPSAPAAVPLSVSIPVPVPVSASVPSRVAPPRVAPPRAVQPGAALPRVAQAAAARAAVPPAPTSRASPAASRPVPPFDFTLPGAASRPRPPAPAPARPAPAPRGQAAEALFGEDLISEKSLDEVILSYLAEDLGEKKP